MRYSLAVAIAAIFLTGADRQGADDLDAKCDATQAAKAFLDNYQSQYARLAKSATLAEWKAANSGQKEDFQAVAEAQLAVDRLHSDAKSYADIVRFRQSAGGLSPIDARALQVAELAFKAKQLPPELIEDMVRRATDITQTFNTYRAELDGRRYTNNELLEMLADENDSTRRENIWAALKQVGQEVAPRLVELAKVRNRAARHLGYKNYWEMAIRLQEHDPELILSIFAELERLTDHPFREMKQTLDAELARRFKIEADSMMPWHYDNPFFQTAPDSEKVDLDEFFENRKKEDIVALAEKFFFDIGLPIEEIVARSDLYEREGKDQHAFCISIDRAGDVRTLLNIKPKAEWMETMLHEQGHAVYDCGVDRSLPFSLREPAHIFTTEAVAMLCGALAKDPAWLVEYAGADKARITELAGDIREQRRREQLIFARWTMVMLYFEKALYENPDRDLNSLWWDCVERYQLLGRPAGRDAPDWAAKPHFSCAPVYYHNYMLGELFAAQLRKKLAAASGEQNQPSEGRRRFGKFLQEKVFYPGAKKPWPQFVEDVIGEPLNARAFAEEVK